MSDPTRAYRLALAQRLFDAEREFRLSREALHANRTEENRLRWVRAKQELEAAEAAAADFSKRWTLPSSGN